MNMTVGEGVGSMRQSPMNNMNLSFCIRFFVMMVASIMLISCANTVVTKPVPELKIQVSIVFDETIDATQYNYYFIFSSQTPQTIRNGYFFIPGDTTNNTSIVNDDELPEFYKDYFSTWDGVFKMGDPTTLQSIMGPFPKNTTLNGHENYSLIVVNPFRYRVLSKTVSFTVSQSDLGGIDDRLYYTVVMTKKTQADTNQGSTTDSNNILDDLNAPQSIALMPNEFNNYSDDDIGGSGNGIKSCVVQVK